MFCPYCGTQNAEYSKFCAGCGAKLGGDQPVVQPAAVYEPQPVVQPAAVYEPQPVVQPAAVYEPQPEFAPQPPSEPMPFSEPQPACSGQSFQQPYYQQPAHYQQAAYYQQSAYPAYQQPASLPGQGLGIAGMVLGIISLVCCCVWYISGICAVVGLILSIISVVQGRKVGKTNGYGVAGIICCIIGIVFALIIILAFIGNYGYVMTELESYTKGY